MKEPIEIRTKVALLIAILAMVAVATAIKSVYDLYGSLLEIERESLSKIVERQVYIIDTISQNQKQTQVISDANAPHANFTKDEIIVQSIIGVGVSSFSETGELVIGRRDTEAILLYWSFRQSDNTELATKSSKAIPFQSNLAEPLRKALQGETGTIVVYDYTGRTVMAAYAPTSDGVWGVVAKIDMAEMQRPFVSVAFISMFGAIIMLFISYYLFILLSRPLVEKVKIEEELLDNKQQIDVILDNTADGIISMSVDGAILSFNRAAEKMFCYSSQEVVGKNVAILMTGFDADRHGGYVNNYLESRTKKIIGIGPREVNGVRKDGSLIPIDLAVNEVKGREKVVFVGSVRDISERISQRKRIQRSQKIEAIGQLTRGVATDFNNILISIKENLDALEGKHGNDTQSLGYINEAKKASKYGVEMVQRLIAFSKRQQLTPESIDIKKVIADTVELATPSLGLDIKVTLDLSRDLWSIVADKGQFENTLLSLCLNARDAMIGGGVLHISAENQELNKDEADLMEVLPGEYIRLCVEDNGAGMPEDVVKKAFQPFFTTKEFGKGSGLGLSIIHSFVHQAGGEITLHSEVGKGTRVDILFPRHGQTIHST